MGRESSHNVKLTGTPPGVLYVEKSLQFSVVFELIQSHSLAKTTFDEQVHWTRQQRSPKQDPYCRNVAEIFVIPKHSQSKLFFLFPPSCTQVIHITLSACSQQSRCWSPCNCLTLGGQKCPQDHIVFTPLVACSCHRVYQAVSQSTIAQNHSATRGDKQR